MWVATHKCMEAILGISLYSYLYLKLAKNDMFFLLSLMFSLQQNWRTSGWIRFYPEAGGREVAQTMYTNVSKCKNDEKKKRRRMTLNNKTSNCLIDTGLII
jgi:hypothetical protein